MKKTIATLLAVISMVTVLAVSVSAVAPGDSDYKVTSSVDLSTVKEDKFELTNTDSKSVIAINKKALPTSVTSVTFAAKELGKTTETYVAANKAIVKAGFKNASVFDFKLLDQNNAEIANLNGKVSVTVACPKGVNTVLYYNDKDGKVTELGGKVKDGFITFETNHFSYYVLAEKATTKNPQTGDANPLIFVGLVSLVVAGGIFAGKKLFVKTK